MIEANVREAVLTLEERGTEYIVKADVVSSASGAQFGAKVGHMNNGVVIAAVTGVTLGHFMAANNLNVYYNTEDTEAQYAILKAIQAFKTKALEYVKTTTLTPTSKE